MRQRQHRLSAGEVVQLLTDYRSGLTVAAVARKYNVDVKTATKHLTDNDIAIRPKKVAIPATEYPALLDLKAAGWNNIQIAQHYGCSRQAVQQALKRTE